MLQTFFKAIVFLIGFSGFYAMFAVGWQNWWKRRDYRAVWLARKRQTESRAHVYKEKYGSVGLVSAVLLWWLAAFLSLALGPVLASLAFSNDQPSVTDNCAKVFSAVGTILLTYQANSWLIKRCM